MSNRAKWAHSKLAKTDRRVRAKNSIVGLVFVVVGLLLLWSGLQGLSEGKLWFVGFGFVSGRPAIRLTASLVVLGGALIVAGFACLMARE
jgi:uncharacterized membrane protein YphA (DoxX/SURF4 family)